MKNITYPATKAEHKEALAEMREYVSKTRVFTDSEQMANLKEAINTVLTPIEKEMLLIYSVQGSYKRAAEILGISAFTARKMILEIKDKLLNRGEHR